jgi:hypothetical protein
VLINAGGDDVYTAGQLALGAGNCNGVGIFVDEKGDDTYTTNSTLSGGVGNTSSECVGERPDALTAGIMIDANGIDTYTWPAGMTTSPANNAQFGVAGGGLESEKGIGVDGEGESKIR